MRGADPAIGGGDLVSAENEAEDRVPDFTGEKQQRRFLRVPFTATNMVLDL